MMDTYEKVSRLQGERLADCLGVEPGTFFEIAELESIANCIPFEHVMFRGKQVRITMAAKALADLLLIKIRNYRE
jgi:hypothetical protein